ncbi:MAG: cyclic-di-AMP receptor [Anaerolineaceae bacterium]|nr:cyclic-di-AMP receptor [Anaerolineaceae bacterium]
MKLIIAIIPDNDTDQVSKKLTDDDLRVTLIASTGGFLKRGYSTMLLGLQEDQVDQACQLIREGCSPKEGSDKKSGTIFVLPVDKFLHI